MEKKKMNITSASLVDLKAELFRKQEEFKQQKLKLKDASYVKSKPPEKKADIWSRKNVGVLKRAQKDYEEKVEEEDVLDKSRKSLQAKAKMYEKISHSSDIPEEDGSKIYLVDFQKKVIDKIVDDKEQMRIQQTKEEEEELQRQEEEILSKADVPPPASEGEEWVDYVDSFGRSRRCMKQDLNKLMKKDAEVKKYIQPQENSNSSASSSKEVPDLMSNDMYREMLRQKWEKEEREALNGPIHYANVQFDEIRTHGTGYYQFAKDEATRQEQMEALGDLRKQTVDERSRQERLKQKRKAMMEARLAKVKQRKKMREGRGLLGQELGQDEKEEADAEIGPKLEEMTQGEEKVSQEPELLTRDVNINKGAPVREWDKGKEELFAMSSEDRYFKDRRDERQAEFAPPSFYFTDNKKRPSTKTDLKRPSLKIKQEKDSLFETPVVGADKIDDFLTWDRQTTSQSKQKVKVEPNRDIADVNPNEIVLTREMAMQEHTNIKVENTVGADKIDEFLKCERQAVSHSRQKVKVEPKTEIADVNKNEISVKQKIAMQDHTNIKMENTFGKIDVGQIPLPNICDNVTVTEDKNTSDSFPDRSHNYTVLPQFSQQFVDGDVQNSLMVQQSSHLAFPPPNLKVPPPPLPTHMAGAQNNPVIMSNVSLQDFTCEPYCNPTSHSAPLDLPGTKFISPVYISNETKHQSEHATVFLPNMTVTKNAATGQTTTGIGSPPVAIPRSSIIDTRLMLNQGEENSDDDYNDVLVPTNNKISNEFDENQSTTCSGQSVFTSGPVVYSKNAS